MFKSLVFMCAMYLVSCMALAQFGGYGSNPAQMMVIPTMPMDNSMGNPLERLDTSQIPTGWRDVKPTKRLSDGTPVYSQMPIYDEVKEEFVVQIYFPISDRFSMSEWVWVPADGRRRRKFRKELEARLEAAKNQSRINTAVEYCSGGRLADMIDAERTEAVYRQRQQELRDKEHRRQLDLSDQRFYHMNQNQFQHYRDGWQPVVQPVGGLQYGTPDLMVVPNGNDVYRVW